MIRRMIHASAKACLFLTIFITSTSPAFSFHFLQNDEPIVFFLAGNMTCEGTRHLSLKELDNKKMFPHSFNMIKPVELAYEKQFQWVMGCFDLFRNLYYKTSANPNKIIPATVSEFIKAADDFWNENPNRKGIIVSHSYGAWLGIKLASSLQKSFHSIFTVDPINPKYCGIENPRYCRWPKRNLGFKKSMLHRVGENSELWMNFYQKKDHLIRSNPLDFADRNQRIRSTHQKIDDEKNVWTSIKWNFYKNIYRR